MACREIPNPQVNVSKTYPYGGVDFNRAMSVVYVNSFITPKIRFSQCL